MQSVAISLSTPFVIALIQPGFDRNDLSFDVVHLLKLTYLLLAVGVALTKNRFVESTAAAIATASRKMNRLEPAAAASTLLLCLWICTVGLAAMTIATSPTAVPVDLWQLGPFGTGQILWSATTSIGVAAFGANAQAANQAQDKASRG